MAKNAYFNHTTDTVEQSLINDLVVECIQIYGEDMYYIPRTIVDYDPVFGEDVLSQFDDAYLIETYISTVDGFNGEGDFLSKFGLEIRKSATLIMAKSSFEQATSANSNITRPKEGDLMYFPLTQALLVVKFVNHENPFYQLGKSYTYTLDVEMFDYSNETVDTGIEAIDDIADDYENDDILVNDEQAMNDDFETLVDGGSSDGHNNNGTDDRSGGYINFDETHLFGE